MKFVRIGIIMQVKYLLFLTLLYSAGAYSGVNLKNGNFYISYSDLESSSSDLLEISRTYNSKSVHRGWFGFGWGSYFETRLRTMPDEGIHIKEHGGGGNTYYFKVDGNDQNVLTSNINKIVNAYRDIEKESVSEEKIEKIKNNLEFRQQYWQRYVDSGVLEDFNFSAGEIWKGNSRGVQQILSTVHGFERVSLDGEKEYFDRDGYLTKLAKANGYWVEVEYYKAKVNDVVRAPKRIFDSDGENLFFFYGDIGRVAQMITKDGTKSWYQYSNRDELIFVADSKGNTYRYEYDENFNLTKIRYDDGSSSSMSYEPEKMFVSKIIDRYGEVKSYSYSSDPKDPQNHYWTEVKEQSYVGHDVLNRYEYWVETNSKTGERFTRRKLTSINGVIRDETYSQNGEVETIKRSNNIEKYKYNNDGKIVELDSPLKLKKIEYDVRFGKIKRVDMLDKQNQKTEWSDFEYDNQGNLIAARNSNEENIKFTYSQGDRKNIIEILSEEFTLSFEYQNDKPSSIGLHGVGTITVKYDKSKLIDVYSKDGYKVSLEITERLQDVMRIVEPAEVNLNL